MSQEQQPKREEFGDVSTMSEEQQQPKPTTEAFGDDVSTVNQEQEPKQVAFGDVSTTSEEQQQAKPEAFGGDVSTLSQENSHEVAEPHKHALQQAVTYGDVFPATTTQDGPLASEAITMQDAALMQTAESLAFGHTIKGGAASAMQSAAARNVEAGFLEKDAPSRVSESGLSVTETAVPGATMDVEYVAGQPVSAAAHPTPTDPFIASMDAITVGEALEAAALAAGDRPVEDSDARAIESAERRATGISRPMKGGIGATAQSAAQLNQGMEPAWQTTLSDVLMDATADLPADKVVTYEDAFRVIQAETRGGSIEDLKVGGVGATLIAAADMNERSGLLGPPTGQGLMNLEGVEEGEEGEDAAVAEELGQYEPVDSQADLTKEVAAPTAHGIEIPSDVPAHPSKEDRKTEEETTPLVSYDTEEPLPSHGNEELPAPKQTEI